MLEELRHKDGRVATMSWDTYPIATFRDAPESIQVLVEGEDDRCRAEPVDHGDRGGVDRKEAQRQPCIEQRTAQDHLDVEELVAEDGRAEREHRRRHGKWGHPRRKQGF